MKHSRTSGRLAVAGSIANAATVFGMSYPKKVFEGIGACISGTDEPDDPITDEQTKTAAQGALSAVKTFIEESARLTKEYPITGSASYRVKLLNDELDNVVKALHSA